MSFAQSTKSGTWVKEEFSDKAVECPGLDIDSKDNPIVVAFNRFQYGQYRDQEIFLLLASLKWDEQWHIPYSTFNLNPLDLEFRVQTMKDLPTRRGIAKNSL
jgi:hypothetical protein